MFDSNKPPLKREYETLGWQALPVFGQRERGHMGRMTGRAALWATALLAASAIVLAVAG